MTIQIPSPRMFPRQVRPTRVSRAIWTMPEDQIEDLMNQLEFEEISSTPVATEKTMARSSRRSKKTK